jgi:hypothetical protein
MFSHAFSRSSIMDMKPFVLREIYWMITVFAKKIAAGKDIDLLQTNKLFTSDVITYAGFGLTEDMVRHDKQNTIVETADNMVLAINLVRPSLLSADTHCKERPACSLCPSRSSSSSPDFCCQTIGHSQNCSAAWTTFALLVEACCVV